MAKKYRKKIGKRLCCTRRFSDHSNAKKFPTVLQFMTFKSTFMGFLYRLITLFTYPNNSMVYDDVVTLLRRYTKHYVA